MSPGNSFATRLIHAMGALNMTVAELHTALGGIVSERSIWRWRSGQAAPGIEALSPLALALHTTPHWLLAFGQEDA